MQVPDCFLPAASLLQKYRRFHMERTEKRIASAIAEELKVRLWQVEAAVALIDEGNTIPFITRYRKEAT